MAGAKGSKVWSAFSLISAIGAATVVKKIVTKLWQTATGKNPPANPADPEVDVWEAVAWAAFSGTLIALARMLATRKAANYYIRSTGKLPPEMQKGADGKPLQDTTT